MSNIISDAFAAVNGSSQGNSYSLIIMLLISCVIIYFMILRPQQKRTKEHKKLMDSISKGDEILTSGGLIGRVTKITEVGYVYVELNDNIEVIIKIDFISSILPKGTLKTL
ncbi:MAG: preprotein translocase subunit YajC [Pantoea sp. Brub]|nr:preprotein translocase subunit YajC [Pantoea sp. Brub]